MRYGLMCAVAVLALAGCGVMGKHNDVMIFGTTTKIAIDVSAPVQNASVPEFTIGYKRHEAVWMPLRPNGEAMPGGQATQVTQIVSQLQDCTKALKTAGFTDADEPAQLCIAMILPKDKYVSYASGVDKDKGGAGSEIDTYSVFASFGGRGSLGFSDSSGALAQFFATGIAAQRLGANPAVGLALNADGEKPAAEQAKADTAKAKADAARTALAASRVVEPLEKEATAMTALKAKWGDCPDPAADDTAKYIAALDHAKATSGSSSFWETLKALDGKEFILDLLSARSAEDITAFSEGIDKACTGG